MALKVSIDDDVQIERFVLVNIIGLMESLLNKAVTIEEVEFAFFLHILLMCLKRKKLGKKLLN